MQNICACRIPQRACILSHTPSASTTAKCVASSSSSSSHMFCVQNASGPCIKCVPTYCICCVDSILFERYFTFGETTFSNSCLRRDRLARTLYTSCALHYFFPVYCICGPPHNDAASKTCVHEQTTTGHTHAPSDNNMQMRRINQVTRTRASAPNSTECAHVCVLHDVV